MTMKKKVVALVLVCVLVFGIAVGGTLAWLMDKTESIKNTFTVGDVDIELTETKGADIANGKEFKVVPGAEVEKDPTVTVKANSENCWLFVKVEKSTNFDNYVDVVMAEGWTQIGTTGVFYREVTTSVEDQPFSVLKGDKVTGDQNATKTMYDTLGKGGDPIPEITFTAYAVQKTAASTAAEAWDLAQVEANY
jgi:predicted ribosomally synthesized peptide with SipW-like signal peptide